MDYKKIYNQFILDRVSKEPIEFKGVNYHRRRRIHHSRFFEHHHIVPRSLGGSDNCGNIVALSSFDHIRAHLLLAKIYGGNQWGPISFMIKGRNIPSHKVMAFMAKAREARRIILFGEGNHFYGKKHSKASLDKMRCSKVYVLSNKYNIEISGTQGELVKMTKISSSRISAVCLGTARSAGGWRNKDINKDHMESKDALRGYWRSQQNELYLYHKDGRIWNGYPVDAPVKMSQLTKTKNKQVDGWFLSEKDRDSYCTYKKSNATKAAESRGDISGANNPRADKMLYSWKHEDTGEVFTDTRFNAYATGRMKKSGVTDVFSGRQVRTNNWLFLGAVQ